ncbi:MAG: hypothetical protein U0Q18_37015 [Bryobacteraceae bacterium]
MNWDSTLAGVDRRHTLDERAYYTRQHEFLLDRRKSSGREQRCAEFEDLDRQIESGRGNVARVCPACLEPNEGGLSRCRCGRNLLSLRHYTRRGTCSQNCHS